jgi:hypothetical protein
MTYYYCGTRYHCNTDILVENEIIKNSNIGDLVIECTQNEKCLKKFCYYCKQYISFTNDTCNECKISYENENENVYNYYINKDKDNINKDNINENENTLGFVNDIPDIESVVTGESVKLDYNESSYLYLNKEITVQIAVEEILKIVKDVNNYIICPICKNSLYKTEKCNGMSHHNIERCYVCGRIGLPIRGLGEHWDSHGVGGCFRFDYESYVRTYIKDYICSDTECSNHDIGDCKDETHIKGIIDLQLCRKRSYIYHILKIKLLFVDIGF